MTTPAIDLISLHTPGPFEFHRDSDGIDDEWTISSTVTGQQVATITFWDCSEEWSSRAFANAHLLSAAAELLDAARSLLTVIATILGGLSIEAYEAEQRANAAIAKAEGRVAA